jgi:hypothetical protein
MAVHRHPVILGTARFTSGFMSNGWHLTDDKGPVGSFTRYPSLHLSRGTIAGKAIEIRPEGWGTVVAYEEGRETGRIVRRSWMGRRWELSGQAFACELISEPMPRRWTLRIGGHPVSSIAGTTWSYNRLSVHTDVSVPAWSLALAWHVVVRPWEAAAAPRTLRPPPTESGDFTPRPLPTERPQPAPYEGLDR